MGRAGAHARRAAVALKEPDLLAPDPRQASRHRAAHGAAGADRSCNHNARHFDRRLGFVTGPLTDARVTGPLTDTQLRASALPVSLASVPTHAVTGPLTDVELRASVLPVSLASVPTHAVTGPLTDTQLRASVLPVSLASVPTHAVTGPLTDTELRASVLPVSNVWPFPAAVTPIAQQSAVLVAAQGTATLAAAANKFTYLSGLQIFGTGATAASAVNATIAGLLGGTMTIPVAVPAGANLGITPIVIGFDPPLRSGAVNTAIVVTLPSLGSGNTRATVNAQGFQQ
jgi:hypothetical protein